MSGEAKTCLDCDAICVAQMPGWEISAGVNLEIEYFCENGKPLHMLPRFLTLPRKGGGDDFCTGGGA